MAMFGKLKFTCGVLLFFLGGCGGPGFYEASYRPSVDAISNDQAYMLEKGAKPQLMETEDFEMILQELTEQNYIIVGQSEFNAQIEKYNKAIGVAKDLSATHVLVSTKYLYNGTKRSHVFEEYYDVTTEVSRDETGYRVNYVSMPNIASIPYLKSVPIYHHRAAYLVRRR